MDNSKWVIKTANKKMTNKKTTIGKILSLGLFIILLPSLVNAFGIGMTYTQNNPLILGPGEAREIQLTPNSMASEGALKLTARIMKGSEIASFIDSNAQYNLPAGGQIPIKVRISIPKGVNEGTEYIVTFNFMDATKSEGEGTISIKTASEVSMKVLVKKPAETTPAKKPANENIYWPVMVIVLIIMIAIIAYFLLTKKETPSKSK